MGEESNNINIDKIVSHWVDTSNNDFETMNNLYKSRDYSWALFIGHIVLERLLKAYFVKVNKTHAPFTHDLLRLASLSNLELDEEKSDWLDSVTTFNMNARYDSYKQEFYNKCTSEFTELWVNRIKLIREWIKIKL
jgi:HEPN domain-containing protein